MKPRQALGNEGNALILCVLVMLALTSVGVISIQRTNTELMVAGNVSRATQAFIGGQAGMIHGLTKVGVNPESYLQLIELQRDDGDPVIGIAKDDSLGMQVSAFSTALPAGTNPADHIPYIVASQPQDQGPERMRQEIAYDVRADYLYEDPNAVGYDVDGPLCLHVFDFNARGGIPTRLNETVEETMTQSDTVVIRNRARASVGPSTCRF